MPFLLTPYAWAPTSPASAGRILAGAFIEAQLAACSGASPEVGFAAPSSSEASAPTIRPVSLIALGIATVPAGAFSSVVFPPDQCQPTRSRVALSTPVPTTSPRLFTPVGLTLTSPVDSRVT